MKQVSKSIICTLAVIFICAMGAKGQSALSASHLKAAEAVLMASNTSGNLEITYQNIIKTSSANVPEENREKYIEIMTRFMNKYMGWDALRAELTTIYAEEFTEAELKELAKFYASPLGKKVTLRLPELQRKGMELGQQKVQLHQAELKEEFEKAFPK